MIYLLVLIFSNIWGCVDINKSDNENLLCILSIEKKSDITPNLIENCSKLASLDKFIGYLCLCKINRISLKTDLAILSCSKAKIKNPFSPYPHLEFAEIYKLKNKNDVAITETEFALNIDSENFHANLKTAELLEDKNMDKSLKYYINALEILKKSNQPYIIGKKTYIENKIKKIKSKIENKKNEEKELKYLNCIKDYKNEKDPHTSVEIIEKCLTMKQTHNPTIYLDYIKTLYLAEMYEKLIQNKYLKLIPPKNINELNIMLADSYYKTGRFSEATKYYKKIINDEIYDTELLSKYADALEKSNDKVSAIEIYRRINIIKPSQKLQEKIDEMKIEIMSDEDILNDLKTRGFIEKEKVILLPPEKKLFLSVKLSERNGAIKYLSETYPGYANIIWKNPSDPQDIKMTYAGYSLYIRYVSQNFIKIIEKEALDPRDIFKVRDQNGFDIFDKNGNLTYEGLKCYYDYEKNKKKNWYFQYETLPKIIQQESYLNSEKQEEFVKKKKELEKLGYEEIAETEYLWLLKATNCPEDVLLSAPCYLKKLDSGNGTRFFMCMKEGMCNTIQTSLASYITSYRNGNTDIPTNTAVSNFFGKPASSKKRFCENGKIWQGD